MSAFDRYFHARYLGVRAYVFSKVFLAVVALDTWMLMIGHAGRYGVAGFNVAHFRWLDRLAPLPSASLYIAVLLGTGLLALSVALLGTSPWAMAALFLLYTYSWSMSMLDSYQHHYFVSLILLCMIFFPRVQVSELLPSPAPAPVAVAAKATRKQRPAADGGGVRGDLIYLCVCVAALGLYAAVDVESHPWLLFSVCAGTLAVATFLHGRKAARSAQPSVLVMGFGYNLLGASIALLYTFTSIAKMDAQWCQGFTLRRISTAGKTFAPLADIALGLGMPNETFWSLLSTSVIPVELTIACGYALAVVQDDARSRWLQRFTHLTFWLALSLHVGAEALGLEIGWFSYYMILLACCYLLPGRAVESLSQLITRPAQLIATQLADSFAADSGKRAGETVLVVGAVCAMLAGTGFLIDLPGAHANAIGASLVLAALMALAFTRERTANVRRIALGVGCASALMWAAIAASEVRWDFYRYLGGDLQRRGELQPALVAYKKGERYAPKGSSRRDRIDELQRRLNR